MAIEVLRGLGLGGAESLLVTRLEHDRSMGRQRTSMVINSYSPANFFVPRIVDSGLDFLDLETSSRWVSAWKLWKVAARFPAGETVVVHSPWPAAVLKLRRALGLSNFRLVEVSHSTSYVLPTRLLGLLLNRFADLCVAVSAEVASGPSSLGFRKVVVILAGVNRRLIRNWVESNPNAPADFRHALGLEETNRLIVSVGNLRKLKRHKMLIEALPYFDDDTHVVVVGEGPEHNFLNDLAIKYGVSKRIHFLGQEQDAWRWAAVADLVAHPSEREGLPIALVEARAIGVPIVAFNVGGVATLLGEDSYSTVISIGDEEKFPEVLVSSFSKLEPIQEVFSTRALEETFWDIERFTSDFYRTIECETNI